MSVTETIERMIDFGPVPAPGYHTDLLVHPDVFEAIQRENIPEGVNLDGVECDQIIRDTARGPIQIVRAPGVAFAEFLVTKDIRRIPGAYAAFLKALDSLMGEKR